jgi:hypothetical protein
VNGFCDDEAVLLICPTCQVSAQSVGSGYRRLLCMGLFSIFLAGAAATRRDTLPEGAYASEAFAATKWRTRHDSNV